jgi:hypothetical protein
VRLAFSDFAALGLRITHRSLEQVGIVLVEVGFSEPGVQDHVGVEVALFQLGLAPLL